MKNRKMAKRQWIAISRRHRHRLMMDEIGEIVARAYMESMHDFLYNQPSYFERILEKVERTMSG